MGTIGKILVVSLLMLNTTALAAVRASVDRNEISVDESISLKIASDSEKGGAFDPKFDSVDFEIMNQFESSQYSSVYVNGKFENKSEKSVTYILRPLKNGTLKIKNIRNQGTDEHAPDITIQVTNDPNAGRKNLAGSAPSLKGDDKNFFVKAEISKTKVFKGEQVIVSYYIYRRTRATIRDVMQYPTFQGFIREDLEMPILSGRPDFEAVSLGGVPFERALLSRYALYPIKEGKLKVDSLAIRADYIPKNTATDDMMEDPFFQFFSQVTPRTGTSRSDPINIEVLPLPEDGKTSLFTGGVGTFEVSSQLEPGTYKANAPLNLKVTIQGKGNISLIEFPTVNWPKDLKFYETQGKSKNLGQGKAEKTFDVVIVPQAKGDFEIPPIEFEFFDPDTRSYVRKKTSPTPVHVIEGDAVAPTGIINKAPEEESTPTAPQTWGKLKIAPPNEETPFMGQPWWRWVAWGGLLVFFSFVGLIIYDQVKKSSQIQLEILKRKQDQDSYWVKLQRTAQDLGPDATVEQISPLMEQMIDQVYKIIDERFRVASRSLPQRELGKVLTESPSNKLTQEQWSKISSLLEFAEMIRFVGGTGMLGLDEIRSKALTSIEDARKLCSEISIKA